MPFAGWNYSGGNVFSRCGGSLRLRFECAHSPCRCRLLGSQITTCAWPLCRERQFRIEHLQHADDRLAGATAAVHQRHRSNDNRNPPPMSQASPRRGVNYGLAGASSPLYSEAAASTQPASAVHSPAPPQAVRPLSRRFPPRQLALPCRCAAFKWAPFLDRILSPLPAGAFPDLL